MTYIGKCGQPVSQYIILLHFFPGFLALLHFYKKA